MSTVVQGGHTFSRIFPHHSSRNNNNNVPNTNLQNNSNHPSSTPASHLEWNSQLGSLRQSQSDGEPGQVDAYANFAVQENQNSPQFGQVESNTGDDVPCRTRDRVYLPDMQSYLISTHLTYQEAVQACIACGSELVLVDGTNIDRFREAFSSLGLYGDQRFWIKRQVWFGERQNAQGTCPAVLVNSLMGNRLEPANENCNTRFYALCY
ncbi:hypothetical protein BGZ76_008284 [Entomortierella beljakovae]|nr:hypothetical protein BGZ76_008284 [Entomortierella beljakovae]